MKSMQDSFDSCYLKTPICGHDDDDKPSFNQIMLMITNQQMANMQERAESHEDEKEEQRFCMEEQWEDCCMQMQM